MYIPLYNRTNYTLLSSLIKIDDLVNYAKKNNISYMAISDNNMFGTMEFIKKCNNDNIVPIVGLECNLDKYSIVLYAKSYKGYQNLIKLSTIQSERVICIDDLKKYSKDLICIIPFIYHDSYELLKDEYIDIYLGYSNKKEEQEALLFTKNIVFFPLNLYLDSKDKKTLSYLYMIRDGKTISDEVKYEIDNHFINIPNINEYSSNIGIDNTLKIVSSCKIEFPPFQNLLPEYDTNNPEKYLFELCKAGLSKRLGGEIPNNYRERLTHELTIIVDMGFPNYFLVVYDFIKYAKKNKILVGPGRGSAAGSLVAYSLGITDIDPLKYDLLFERFLNPERKTMPDIDTDFPDNKREMVIDYVKEKYGEKRVAGIIAFGTLAAKQVIRDVSRVMNIPLYKVDSLCKLINSDDSLKDLYDKNVIFKTRIDSDTSLSDMFSIALKLEGFPRHTSQHAAGIVMCKKDLDEVVPLVKTNDLYLTAFDKDYLEDLGLLKMDFLVIKTLTMIDNIINDINDIYKEEIEFSKIPLDDKKTLELFTKANTCGIFQFESSGMRNLLRQIKPSNFEDIVSAIALFRPGAAINIDSFVKRKHGLEKIEYLDPSLEEITKKTYGILLYQEQIVQLANIYAGYTLGEADILRRAMSKKKYDLLKSEEERFINKSIEKGHSKEKAKEIFDIVLQFAEYGFNKAHSVVYSVVAYKMAYLKCHYPTVFYSNLLSNVIGADSKTYEYILDAKKEGLEIEKPTIDNSSDKYLIVDNRLIYPLSSIKSIGSVVVEKIKNAKEKGPFIDIFDCFSRLYIAGLTKKNFETLIYADVFHNYNINRKTLINNIDNLYNYAELTKDLDPSLVMKPEIEKVDDYDQYFLLQKEKEVFGFYLSLHPTNVYRSDNPNCIYLEDVSKYFDKTVDLLILVDKIKVIQTKKNDNMAFVTGSDETDSKEFIFFPKIYSQYDTIKVGNILKIRGKVEKRLDEIQIIVDKVRILQGDSNE